MGSGDRSRPPNGLIIVIAIVGSLGILVAATVSGTARSVQLAGWVGLNSLSIDIGTD